MPRIDFNSEIMQRSTYFKDSFGKTVGFEPAPVFYDSQNFDTSHVPPAFLRAFNPDVIRFIALISHIPIRHALRSTNGFDRDQRRQKVIGTVLIAIDGAKKSSGRF